MTGGPDFRGYHVRGLTQAQLASTASYQAKDLTGIQLDRQRPDRLGLKWAESHQRTNLDASTLTNANLMGANLTDAPSGRLEADGRQPDRGGGDGGELQSAGATSRDSPQRSSRRPPAIRPRTCRASD